MPGVGNAVIGALRVNLGIDSAEFETGVKRVQGQLGGIGKAFAALGGTAIFAGFIAGLGGAVKRLEETRKLSAQLDRALANTGNAAKTSAKEVEAFADKLERRTGRAAEEVLAIGANLATFDFGREAFFRAIELADDMAAAWGGDLKQNIEGLGRALAEPEKGLAMLVKRGITFDDQQKAQIANFMKVNDLAGAQGVIFEALEGQVKGVAEAGFSGLTRASANAWKAVEDLFEGMASGLQVAPALEMALTGAAAAIDLITANLDTIGKVATVAGVALGVALGPTVWGLMSAAAVSFGKTVKDVMLGIRTAINAANPFALIATALAAAVTAAFVFRDQIKRAIGVDVVAIAKTVGNVLIRTFDLAFRNVATIWGRLPAVLGDIVMSTANAVVGGIEAMINGAIDLINGFTRGARDALGAVGLEVGDIGGVEIGEVDNPWKGALGGLGGQLSKNAADTSTIDYIGQVTSALTGMWTSGEDAAAAVVKGFGDISGAAGAAGGAISEKMQGALDALRQSLMTEEEAELASYQKRLAQIEEFYAAGAILKAEYNDLKERAEEQHGERMKALAEKQVEEERRIREQSIGGVASIMGSISSLLESSGAKNLAITKAFAVGEAVANTALGITKALTLPPPASWIQAGAVAASGAAQIATILSASKGTATRPGISSANVAAAPQAQQGSALNLTIRGSGMMSVDDFASQLTKGIADGGYQPLINVIRAA